MKNEEDNVEIHSRPETNTTPTRRPRGFAAMDRTRVAQISSMGGRAAHAAGTAHRFSKEEAVEAGRKGGTAPHVRRGRQHAKSSPKVEPLRAVQPGSSQ